MTDIFRTKNIAYCLSPDRSVLLRHSVGDTESAELSEATKEVCSWIRAKLCDRFLIQTEGGMPPANLTTIKSLRQISSAINEAAYPESPRVGLITPERSVLLDSLILMVRTAVRSVDLDHRLVDSASEIHEFLGLTEGDLDLLQELNSKLQLRVTNY